MDSKVSKGKVNIVKSMKIKPGPQNVSFVVAQRNGLKGTKGTGHILKYMENYANL